MSIEKQKEACLLARRYVLGAEKALVLPSLSHPKLIVPASGLKIRWMLSAFFPAFKLKAKLWRLLQRIRCVTGLAPVITVENDGQLHAFISEILPGVMHTSVLLGTSGPDQKIIVQLWRNSEVAGYLKVAIAESADRKITAEAEILNQLPPGAGPRLLKSGILNGREAIVLSPVKGRMVEAKLPASVDGCPLKIVKEYLAQLRVSGELFEIDEHPAIVRLRLNLTDVFKTNPDQLSTVNEQLGGLLEPLRKQRWPVVIQHGDFAPWNVLRVREEKVTDCQMEVDKELPTTNNLSANNSQLHLRAIDWEEGCLDGFLYFDLIHYVSQTAALVEKWSPEECAQYLMDCLTELPEPLRRSVIKIGLMESWMMLQKSLQGLHWILDWKKKTWSAVDEF